MGTLRKFWRKIRRWFDRKGRRLLEEVKDLIRKVFEDMHIHINDLFDDGKRKVIAAELKARVRDIRDDLTEWIIEWAMEILWDEVREGFSSRRTK